jgi:hypothetical protein
MTAHVAGLLTAMAIVLAFPLAWLVGDHRSGAYPLGPVLRSVGTAVAAVALVVLAAVVGTVIGIGLILLGIGMMG